MGTQSTRRSTRRTAATRPAAREGLADRAFERATAMHRAGRLAPADRIAFAWGWAEGYRAARRELGGGKGT